MKMLSESEIISLCNESQQAAEGFIAKLEKKTEERKAANAAMRENQYQTALQNYDILLKQYEQDLKNYEDAVAKEEEDFPKRLAEWEKKEEQHKANLERNYQIALQAYDMNKRITEAAGKVYNMPKPQRMAYFPAWVKPVKKTFRKPSLPQAPQKPDERSNVTLPHSFFSGFSSIMQMSMLMSESPFSERAIRQIDTMNIANPEDRKKAIKILFREMYISKRTSMECSYEEGRGISPALDGLYGEKLTIFELEQCVFNALSTT